MLSLTSGLGRALSGKKLGEELSLQPFDGSWTLQAGVTLVGNTLVYTAAANNQSGFRATIQPLNPGRRYQVTYTVDSVGPGGFAAFVGGTPSTLVQATPGTFTERLVSSAINNLIAIRASGAATTGAISFLSVRPLI